MNLRLGYNTAGSMIVRASRCDTLRVQRKMIWKLRESLERVVVVVGQLTLPPANLKLFSVFSNQPVSIECITCIIVRDSIQNRAGICERPIGDIQASV